MRFGRFLFFLSSFLFVFLWVGDDDAIVEILVVGIFVQKEELFDAV